MADDFNPAQNLDDNARSQGGQNTPSQFGQSEGADPSKAGKKGAKAQPTKAKQKGGEIGGSR